MELSFKHGDCNPAGAASSILEHLGPKAEDSLIAIDCDNTLFYGNIETPVVTQRLMSVDQWHYNHAVFKQLLCPLDFKALISANRQNPNAPQNTARIEQLGRDLLMLYSEIQGHKPALQVDKESFALKMHYFDEALMEWNLFFSRAGIAFSPVHRMRWFAGEQVDEVAEATKKVHENVKQGIELQSPDEESLFVDFHPEVNHNVRELLRRLRAKIKRKLMVVLSASNQRIVATGINRSVLQRDIDLIIGSTMVERGGRMTAAMNVPLTPGAKVRVAKELAALSKGKLPPITPLITIGNKPQDSPLGDLAESNGGVFVVVS